MARKSWYVWVWLGATAIATNAAAEYVNLLDYEAVHGKEVGTYYGDEGDVTPLRADLDQIPLARDLRAGRASPWLPLHRLA